MRPLLISLLMLNVWRKDVTLQDEDGFPSSNQTIIISPNTINSQRSVTGSFIHNTQVKTRHHRGNREDKRILVKRADVGMEDDQDLPEIMTPGQVIRREIGHTAVLGCNVQNLGKYVVMWKQNGRVISAGELLIRKDARLKLSVTDTEYSLYISSLVMEDESEYTCEVDIMGRPISIVHKLEVLVAPRIQCKDTKVTLNKGANYTLRCSAQGQPNPRVSWTRRSGLGIGGVNTVTGLSLQLINVDRQSEGDYICTASNGVGHPAMATMEINVLYPPEISLDQQYSHNVIDKRTTIKIDCVVHSNPLPQVTWYRNSIKLFETDRVLMTVKSSTWTVKLTNVTSNMFGNYTCVAGNSLGTVQETVHVSGKPSKLVFTSSSLNHNLAHYNLTWTSESFSPITAYKLRFKVSKVENTKGGNVSGHQEEGVGQSSSWSEVAVPVPVMMSFSSTWHYTFVRLQPTTVYDVVGMAKNEYGWGPLSSTFTFYNKGIDYSTQQIKYKEADIEIPVKEKNLNEKNEEEDSDSIYHGKLLIQDRSSAVSILKADMRSVFWIIFVMIKSMLV